MRIIKTLNHKELVEKYKSSIDHEPYLKGYFSKYKGYFLVTLDLDEFLKLLLNSSPKNKFPRSLSELPLMKEVIEQIKEDLGFLETKHPDRGLSGTTIREYLEKFKNGAKLEDCFIREKDSEMRLEGLFYISDGMHRLVAYGLYSNLSIEYFPIELILAKNN